MSEVVLKRPELRPKVMGLIDERKKEGGVAFLLACSSTECLRLSCLYQCVA